MIRPTYFGLLSFVLLSTQLVTLQGFAIPKKTNSLSLCSTNERGRLFSTASTTSSAVNNEETGASSLESSTQTLLMMNNGTLSYEISELGKMDAAVVNLDTSSISTKSSGDGGLELWKRRLITHEDPFSLHKWSAVGYTVSSAILLGTAAVRLGTSAEVFSVIPPEMEAVMNVFTVSNIVMCFASVRMAFIHRQGDITARNAFLGTGVSSLFSGFFMVWISPFVEGNLFDSLWISRSFFAVLVGLNAFFIADTIFQTEEIVEGRRDRKAKDYRGRKIIDTLGYVFPVAWGMPLIISTGLIACVLHDRAWFLEQCQFIDEQLQYPGMQSHIFYQQLSTSLAASYASLFVTLRDKKLISKTQELGGITLFALPALVWSIYTTVIFISYLFVSH